MLFQIVLEGDRFDLLQVGTSLGVFQYFIQNIAHTAGSVGCKFELF